MKKVFEDITGGIVLTEKELEKRVNNILEKEPETLYRDCVVCKDQWVKDTNSTGRFNNHTYTTSDTNRIFLDVITENVCKRENLGVKKVNSEKIKDLPVATYNSGSRETTIKHLPKDKDFIGKTLLEKFKNYCKHGKEDSSSTSETRLVQCLCYNSKQNKGEIEIIDYQIPTTNGQKDNIDLFVRKGENFYITEVKTFGSNESILRCVLEIETYYEKLNDNFLTKYKIKSWKNVKKAILIDKTSKSWEQKDQAWAKNLLKKFNIKVFELKQDFTISE